MTDRPLPDPLRTDLATWLVNHLRTAASYAAMSAYTALANEVGTTPTLATFASADWLSIISHGLNAALVVVILPAVAAAFRRVGNLRNPNSLNLDWLTADPPTL